MPRTPRRRIAEGVYLDRYSLTAKVSVGSGDEARSRELAFPVDSDLKELQRWRERTRLELLDELPRARRGTLAGDAKTYLKRQEAKPASLGSKRSELKAWVKRLGPKARQAITPTDIDLTIAAWLKAGVAPKTIVNRCRTLHHLYVTLANDKRAKTPLDNIELPDVPKRRPVSVDVRKIRQVEKNLRKGDPFVHAFFMTIASTGLRNAQVNRLLQTLTVTEVRRGIVIVDGAKGGEAIPLVLNPDQRAAFRKLLEARRERPDRKAGQTKYLTMDATKYARAVRAAGWPDHVRPYNARHSVGITLADAGVEDSYIQAQLGHSDLKMIRQHYTGVRMAKMRAVSQALEGRLGWGVAPRVTPRRSPVRGRKVAETGGKTRGRKTA